LGWEGGGGRNRGCGVGGGGGGLMVCGNVEKEMGGKKRGGTVHEIE